MNAKIKKNIVAWIIMLPSLLLFAFFVWVPIAKNLGLSFFDDYSFSKFVAFDNYKAIFGDDLFLTALKNTFIYIFYSLIIGFFVPMIIGFLLSECIHAKGLFRVCIYIPCMISGIAVVFLFREIYGDEPFSILNVILKSDRWWKSDQNLVIPLIVIAMTWKGAGGTALIYLSNFQQIDSSLYEASRVDGAKPHQRFFRIMIPQMRNTILTLLVLQVISVFQVFYEPLVIGDKTSPSITLMLLAYDYAFYKSELAKAAATSVFLGLIIIAFTIGYFALVKYLNRGEGK